MPTHHQQALQPTDTEVKARAETAYKELQPVNGVPRKLMVQKDRDGVQPAVHWGRVYAKRAMAEAAKTAAAAKAKAKAKTKGKGGGSSLGGGGGGGSSSSKTKAAHKGEMHKKFNEEGVEVYRSMLGPGSKHLLGNLARRTRADTNKAKESTLRQANGPMFHFSRAFTKEAVAALHEVFPQPIHTGLASKVASHWWEHGLSAGAKAAWKEVATADAKRVADSLALIHARGKVLVQGATAAGGDAGAAAAVVTDPDAAAFATVTFRRKRKAAP